MFAGKMRGAVAMVVLSVLAVAVSAAQTLPGRVQPPQFPKGPVASAHPTLTPMHVRAIGGPRTNLGPKIPLSSLPMLPAKTSRNTATLEGSGRRPMAATTVTEMYQTVSGCSATVGYIFNVGCQIEFQMAWCNENNANANCFSGEQPLNPTDTFQDYYIDATSATAQTIGSTYVPRTLGTGGSNPALPSDCTAAATCPYGPWELLTLNNAGTVVLATYDETKGDWVGVVYITVGSANGLNTYLDATRATPMTQFTIPVAGTNTIYITLNGAQYRDVYVFYIENTSVYTNCTGEIGPTPAGPTSGLCNPNAITGITALSSGNLNAQWTFGAGTSWTALTTGTYSIVAFDQTSGKRVAQTQVSLQATTGTVTGISLTGQGNTGINPSPAPAPVGTPSTRFAFDNTSDASDAYIYQKYTSLNGTNDYCFSFTDPEGRVYSDYVTPTEKFTCFVPGSSSYTITHTNVTSEQPDYFAPNTYTLQVCDFSLGSPCTVTGSEALQVLGYHVTTDFTDATGATNEGTALVVPKGGSSTGGLYFLNDGDTYYGTGNGDTLDGILYSTGGSSGSSGNGSYFVLSSTSVTGLTGTCTTSCYGTVQDSNGNTWYAVETEHGGGANQYTTLQLCPTSWGTSCSTRTASASTLAVGASITIPNITFYPPPGSSSCTGGNCPGPTTILPTDGEQWSNWGSSVAGDLTYFTNSNGNTYAGTGTFIHLGTIGSGCNSSGCGSAFSGTVTAPCTPTSSGSGGVEQQGYFTNVTQALYAQNEPFTPSTGQADVYCVDITNNSTSGTVTGIAFQLPSTYPGASTTIWSVDKQSQSGGALCSGTSTCWTQDTTSGKCPTAANFCIKPSGTNPGIAISSSQRIYIDVQNLPSTSYSFADVSEQIYNPVQYSLTADASCCTATYLTTVPVGTTNPYTVDALSLGAYSIDSSYMTPLFNPTSEGTSTNNNVNISLKNTSTSQDPNPDYVDAIVFEFPTNSYIGSAPSPTINTSGWSYLGAVTPGVGGGSTIDYWFGVCSGQFVSAKGPVVSPTTGTTHSLPLYGGAGGAGCTAAQEQNALSPGSTFSFNNNVATDSTAGTISVVAYAHGANGNGWSKGTTFSLTEATVSATAGFYQAGTYGSPSNVTANTTPQIGVDSNTTFGNSYVYEITNTSGAGHNLTSATITIPGKDSSGALPSDGTAWKITAAPTIDTALSGGSNYGCTLSTSGSNGSATTGGANGTFTLSGCTIPPNSSIYISFSAKNPYTVNDQYQFPAVVNGSINASETWTGDTYVQIAEAASIVISLDAATNFKGNALGPFCGTCVFGGSTINMGSGLLAGSTTAGTDILLVDVYTNVANDGWSLYVTQSDVNSTTGGYLQSMVDTNTSKSYEPVSGVTYNATSYAVIPITGSYASGLKIASTTGTSAVHDAPFEFSNDFQVAIPAAGSTVGNTSTLTYTFVAN
jgi:hypothetical protein